MSGLFDTAFSDFLGGSFGVAWAEPPDRVPLRILGLDTKPTTHAEIKSAFRARVMRAHPDLAVYADPGLREAAEAIAGETPEVQELVWARDVLLRKVPKPAPVTAKNHPMGDIITRNDPPRQCAGCAGQRYRGTEYQRDLWTKYGRQLDRHGRCPACAVDAEKMRKRERRAAGRTGLRCQTCGDPFTPPRSDGRYCSPACRQKAYRARRGGR